MLEAYISLYVFIIFVAGTPGPANLLAMLGGSQKGFKSCIGFIIGLVAGKIPLDILVGLGIGIILVEYSTIYTLFKYISAGYMIYLAVITWNKKYVNSNTLQQSHQFSFKHAVIINPLNPKAWIVSSLAWSNFAPAIGDFPIQLIAVVLGFAICHLLFSSLWCWAGKLLGTILPNNIYLNRFMVIITILVVLWAIY
jgi:threonine/homoserine/homoserine lactone efflux protein